MEDSSGAKLGRLSKGALIAALSCVASLSLARSPDPYLEQAVKLAAEGDAQQVAEQARRAATIEPKSRLAHWLKAQSLLSLTGQSMTIRAADQDLLSEARARSFTRPPDTLPSSLVYISPSTAIGQHILVADLAVSRIYVFRNEPGAPRLVDEFYTTLGLSGAPKRVEGDRKTPIGAYRLLKEIRDPRADGFLGHLAMTLDYPNAEDRQAKRTGSGIWIHGVPDDVHVRPPKASDGCLAVANADIDRLKAYVEYGKTHVVIVPEMQWIGTKDWERRSSRAKRFFDASASGTLAVFEIGQNRPMVSIHSKEQRAERLYWPKSAITTVMESGRTEPLLRERL